MKVEVVLYSGGQTFKEVVIVDKFSDAKTVALARNPTCKVISQNVIFRQ
jgi:hypothetical protein